MSDQMERAKGRIEVDKLDDQSLSEDIEGGYIIETDIHEGNFYSALKRVKMSYKYPKDDECKPEQYTYITDFINRAERRFTPPITRTARTAGANTSTRRPSRTS